MNRMIALLLACCLLLCGCVNTGFSTKRWTENPDGRLEIVDELLADYPLVGMTEQEILDLLGESDNDKAHSVEDNRLIYCLGTERYDIDYSWLFIDFEDGIVVDYSLTKS